MLNVEKLIYAYTKPSVATTASGDEIPTVTERAWTLGLLEEYEVGISFAPPTNDSDINGQLTFGGVDETKINGTLTYV